MSFDRLLVHYLSLSKESLSIDCYVGIPRTLRNLFQSIVTLVFLALLEISFNRLFHQYPSLSKEFLSINCYVSIPRTHSSLFQSIVTSVSVSHSTEFLSIDCYVSIPRTRRSLFQSIAVASVSLALYGISFNRLFRQYPSHS